MPPRFPVHYAWIVAGLGMLVTLACLGLGRFALGVLLPAMGRSLALDYAEMGFVGTANFVGYLVAVFAAGRLARHVRSRVLITAFLLLIAASMAGVSRAGGFVAVASCYLLTGIGSGGANVLAMALVAPWFEASHRGRGAGIVVSGSSLGIMLSGVMIPYLGARFGADGWRASWAAMAALTVLIAALCAWLLRDRPSAIGTSALGRPREPSPGAPRPSPVDSRGMLRRLAAVYFLFGYTYAIYATFLVTALVAEHGFDEPSAGRVWAGVGMLSLVSGPLFGTLSDRYGRAFGFAAAFTLYTTAYLLVALGPGVTAAYLSAACFGVAAWSVPSIMAAAIGDHVDADRAPATLGAITVVFGVGQIAGPGLGGMLAEATGGFTASFLMAAAMAALAIVGSLWIGRSRGTRPAA